MMESIQTDTEQVEVQDCVLSDEQLLLRYRQGGQRELFAMLVRRYERELFNYLRRYLGDAGMALRQGGQAAPVLRQRLDFPSPRVEAGLALRGLATAVIDISDGLLADLGHLLEAGELGAVLQIDEVPRSTGFAAAAAPAAPIAAHSPVV